MRYTHPRHSYGTHPRTSHKIHRCGGLSTTQSHPHVACTRRWCTGRTPCARPQAASQWTHSRTTRPPSCCCRCCCCCCCCCSASSRGAPPAVLTRTSHRQRDNGRTPPSHGQDTSLAHTPRTPFHPHLSSPHHSLGTWSCQGLQQTSQVGSLYTRLPPARRCSSQACMGCKYDR